MKKRVFCCLASLLCWSAVAVRAAKVDTVEVHSRKMGRAVRTIVISPEKTEGKGAAVVYLLHGYGGNETTWPGLKPELKDYADRENLIFVCPNGENSWYWDSPLNEDSQFETFVSRELVSYVDGHYRTLPSREKRAITGLSMGGHGALWLAIRHKEIFGAGGSTSGGVDIRPFPKNWEMNKQLGDYESDKTLWDQHTVITQVDKIKDGDLALIIDCGEQDFFLEVNKALHKVLLEKNISHDFITRPGGHNGQYWNNSIDYQILFFDKFFKK